MFFEVIYNICAINLLPFLTSDKLRIINFFEFFETSADVDSLIFQIFNCIHLSTSSRRVDFSAAMREVKFFRQVILQLLETNISVRCQLDNFWSVVQVTILQECNRAGLPQFPKRRFMKFNHFNVKDFSVSNYGCIICDLENFPKFLMSLPRLNFQSFVY